MASLTPKSFICCYVFKYFLLTDFFFFFKKKKALTLVEKLLNFSGTYMGRKQPFESFLKNGSLSSYFFAGRCVFTDLNFIYTRFLMEVLEESIRIFIYQTGQT